MKSFSVLRLAAAAGLLGIAAFAVPVHRLDARNRPGWVEEVLEQSKLPLEVPQIDLFQAGD